MTNIYQEHILDHYSNPRNKGLIKNPQVYFKDTNPLCGDEVAVYCSIRDGIISDIRFLAVGCAISQASASILSENVKGRSVFQVKGMSAEDMLGLVGIDLSPARMKCALLALNVLKKGIYAYEGKNGRSA